MNSITRWKIRSAGWKDFEKETSVTQGKNTSIGRLEAILETLLSASEKCIPKIKQKGNWPVNIWWNKETVQARKERQRARRVWKRCNTVSNRAEYNRANARAKQIILQAKRDSWKKFVSTIINPNTPGVTVWRHFKAVEGRSYHKMKCFKNKNGDLIQEENIIFEHIAEYYQGKCGRKIPFPKTFTREEQHL